MRPYRRSTRRSDDSCAGFSSIELLVSMVLIGLVATVSSGLLVASNGHVRVQANKLETNQAARAAIDMIVRELRLGGACLPVTGEFISLAGADTDEEDEIVTRTGLTRPDRTCIRATTTKNVRNTDKNIIVDSADGFQTGMRGYVRHPDGAGEFFNIATVDMSKNRLSATASLSKDYPATSGIYAIDERRFFISRRKTSHGLLSELMLQIGDGEAYPFAAGIDKMRVEYELREGCPACELVALPAGDAQWSRVEQVFVSVTARSPVPDPIGNYYERTIRVAAKPRNLLPQ